jgi:hypothetical protein
MRLLSIRDFATKDSAAKNGAQNQVVLSDDVWGFGQWIPNLLLVLPVLACVEGYLGN